MKQVTTKEDHIDPPFLRNREYFVERHERVISANGVFFAITQMIVSSDKNFKSTSIMAIIISKLNIK